MAVKFRNNVVERGIGSDGAAFPVRPVFADMEPTLEPIDELNEFLRKNAEDREAKLAEVAAYKAKYLKGAQKCEETLRRYGVES